MSTKTSAEAFAPATVANMGVGFDILGMAVDAAGDRVRVEKRSEAGAVIAAIMGDDGRLPLEADKNVASIAANALLQAANATFGVRIWLNKGLPIASGLGSSAASAVAAVVAVNELLDAPLSRAELLPFALAGEAVVSGYHADNVAPCLLGGITLNNGTEIDSIHKLPVPVGLHMALVTPDVEVPTADARAALPPHIPLKQMVHQTGVVAALVDALHRGDVRAMARAMEADEVVEPARSHLMPHLDAVRQAAKAAGALALVISGAGPTLCAVCENANGSEQAAQAMQQVYQQAAIGCTARSSRVLESGAYVISA